MEISLGQNQEFRIEVGENQKLKIMVLSGVAEIKGQELLNEKWYVFRDVKTFIFTFFGCRLKIDGICDLQYVSCRSNVPSILRILNFFVENGFNYSGAKVFMVVGHGRSTFCLTLANYFVRVGRKAVFVEIDPSRGNVFPGALSAVCIDTLVDCIEGLKLSNLVSFYYGSTDLWNMELYNLQTVRLQEAISAKNMDDVHLLLCPAGSSEFYNAIIKRFDVNKVVVVGDERLYHMLDLIVDKLMVDGYGVVEDRNTGKSISRYFRGANNEYTPFSFNVKYMWKVVRVGEMYVAPDSALPLGAARKVGCTEASEVELVQNSVLAISEAKEIQEVSRSPVLGYIVIIDASSFKILCTQPKLPKHTFLIQGNFKHVEY